MHLEIPTERDSVAHVAGVAGHMHTASALFYSL